MSNLSKCSRCQAPKPYGAPCKYRCEEFAQPHERNRKRAAAAKQRRIDGERLPLTAREVREGAARAMARK